MAVIPEITCRRCGSKYSGLHSRCPKCGAPRVNQPTRVPPTTASATPRTAASARSASNIRWQFVFAGVLLLAVVLAVVVLVSTGSGRSNSSNNNNNNVNPGNNSNVTSPGYGISADLPTPSPSPVPTPEGTPEPLIDLMAITFLNRTLNNHEMRLTNAGEIFNIDLDVNMSPYVENAQVEWRSTNEKIIVVDSRGIFSVVGASPDREVKAGIIASYGGREDYVTVYIPTFQAAYLTENLFDKETYDEETREWETFIYATPTPRP